MRSVFVYTLVTLAALCAFGAQAQEALIRKNLAERLPNLPKIDEVTDRKSVV